VLSTSGVVCVVLECAEAARGRGESCLLETRLLHKEAIKETLAMGNGHGAGDRRKRS
jgi:hypothetical protein